MTDPARSMPRRVIKYLTRVSITALFVVFAGGLIATGVNTIGARAERAPTADAAPAIPVATTLLERQQGYVVRSEYAGRTEARRRVDLGFEAAGTIADVSADEGAALTRGSVIARLDTRALDARRTAEVASRTALEAETELARLTADRQRTLLERNQVARQRYDEARLRLARLEADVATANARIAAIDVDLSKATLKVPFNATVGTRHLDEGAATAPGQPVLTLIEAAAPEFRVGLPGRVASELSIGDDIEVTLDGRSPQVAKITRIRDDIDPATRTVTVTLELSGTEHVADGTLGRIHLSRSVGGSGFWVPISALSEGIRGLWTIYLVDDVEGGGAVARREAVELLHSEGARAFVRGALGSAPRIVADGPHRLSDGQPVLPEG